MSDSSLILHPSSLPLRLAREYIYQLEHAGEQERLRRALTTIPVFVALYRGETQYEVLGHWSGSDHESMEAAYRRGLEEWYRRKAPGTDQRAAALGFIAEMYDAVSNWLAAEPVQQARLALLRELKDRAGESRVLSSLGGLAWRLGRTEDATRMVREAETIARESGNRRSIAFAVGNRGIVHYHRGEYGQAIACLREQEQIARELGDRQSIAKAIGNRGNVHLERGEYDEALACYREDEGIARELGDRESISMAVGNRGLVHSSRGEYDQALACYRQQEAIAREMGDRMTIAIVIGNLGNLHFYLGEYDQALACLRQKEEIAQEMADPQNVASAVGNRGLIHLYREEYAEALECLRQAVDIHRGIDYRRGLCYLLEGTARVLVKLLESSREMPEYLAKHLPGVTDQTWRTVSLQHARSCAEECLAISRELSNSDTLTDSQELLARIEELTASAGWDHV